MDSLQLMRNGITRAMKSARDGEVGEEKDGPGMELNRLFGHHIISSCCGYQLQKTVFVHCVAFRSIQRRASDGAAEEQNVDDDDEVSSVPTSVFRFLGQSFLGGGAMERGCCLVAKELVHCRVYCFILPLRMELQTPHELFTKPKR